jgi:hypothetical protein
MRDRSLFPSFPRPAVLNSRFELAWEHESSCQFLHLTSTNLPLRRRMTICGMGEGVRDATRLADCAADVVRGSLVTAGTRMLRRNKQRYCEVADPTGRVGLVHL